MAFQYLPLFCCCVLLGGVLGASPKSVKRPKRDASYKQDEPSKLTIEELTVELAKTQLQKLIQNERLELDKAKKTAHILQRDSCTYIKSVGEPVTHNARQITQGDWMKDPLGIMGDETIFVMESYYARDTVEEFENMDKFKAGVTRKTYKLPYRWDGTGAVVYGPYLYYNRENTNLIDKYSLLTERVEATITVSGHTARKTNYQWGGYTSMDLAVDEQGLWLLWASTGNSGKLYASKIDVFKNVITQTWTLHTEPMSSMGNAFVVCGVIYCIDAYNSKSTTINFAYDTKTGTKWDPSIQFTNLYQYNSMVDYNPREKVLYAWDQRRQVTYSLTFEEPSK